MRSKKWLILFVSLLGMMVLLAACGDKTKIAIGPPGSATNNISKEILSAYGLDDGDYEQFTEGFGAAADQVQDGNIEVSIGVLGLPAASIANLDASTGDVKMLGLSDDAVAKVEKNTAYKGFTIPKDSYDFLEEDVQTVAAFAILVGSTDTISEELGYELAKLMVENSDEITHAQGRQMVLENALNGAEELPIHPGAKRYYEEQGLTVDNPVAELNVSDQPSELVLGTGSSGGTYYPLGGEMAVLWNNYIDSINVTDQETGASVENLSLIRDGEMDLGMTVHGTAVEAYNGEGVFEGKKVENVAFIGHIYPEVVQIITREEFGIDSLEDL
ncbi:TAXI family TRAP transporter solute-binding subunit [Bacillaceae bacterium W0354]